MKSMKIGILTTAMYAATSAAFAFSWSDYGAGQTVTLSNTTEVLDADLGVVTNLAGIVIDGATNDLVFANATIPATLNGSITGAGRIVKRGAADVFFGVPATHATISRPSGSGSSHYSDYYTTNGICVEVGNLHAPEASDKSCWFGPLEIAEDATFFAPTNRSCGFDALTGLGTFRCDNPKAVWYHNPEATTTISLGHYGSTRSFTFGGKFAGGCVISVAGDGTFTGTNSTAGITLSILRNDWNGKGVATLKKFGMRAPLSANGTSWRYYTMDNPAFADYQSTFGVGGSYYYCVDFELNYSGTIRYCGEGDETTNKKFRFGATYMYGSPNTIDAGAHGGVTFTGSFAQHNGGTYTDGMLLTGSNTTDMVFAGTFSNAKSLLHFKKTGTGSWRFAKEANMATYDGGWFVEDGTLKYDSLANVGTSCSLGVATNVLPFSYHQSPSTWMANGRLPYEILLGSANAIPTFSYSGSDRVPQGTSDRRIALKGKGAILANANPNGGGVHLKGGIFPETSETADQTVYLTGTGAEPNLLGNLADGATGAKLNVVKRDSGEWRLTRNILNTGSIDVQAGTLSLIQDGGAYRFYRLTIKAVGDTQTAESIEANGFRYGMYPYLGALGLWDKDGNQIKPTMTDVYPARVTELATAAGQSYANYVYPTGFWRCLDAGQIAIGDFKGGTYYTYLERLPSQLFNYSSGLYQTYIATSPNPSNPTAFVPIVFRLPDDLPEVAYFDICQNMPFTGRGYIAGYSLEGSVDAISWTTLYDKTDWDGNGRLGGQWDSTGLKMTNGQNCVTHNFAHAITSRETTGGYSTTLNTVSSVKVAAGAVLRSYDAAIALPKLTVDCADAGAATVKGFAIPATGTLTLENAPRGDFALPVTFEDCTDLANLATWTVQSAAGGALQAKLTVSNDGTVTVKKQGLSLFVK